MTRRHPFVAASRSSHVWGHADMSPTTVRRKVVAPKKQMQPVDTGRRAEGDRLTVPRNPEVEVLFFVASELNRAAVPG